MVDTQSQTATVTSPVLVIPPKCVDSPGVYPCTGTTAAVSALPALLALPPTPPSLPPIPPFLLPTPPLLSLRPPPTHLPQFPHRQKRPLNGLESDVPSTLSIGS